MMIEFCIRRDMRARCQYSEKKKHTRGKKTWKIHERLREREFYARSAGLRGRVAAKKSRRERARGKKKKEKREGGKKSATAALRWRT